jgi:hypothetical protein
MQVIENNKLFTEITSEESATVSGGLGFNFVGYAFGLGAALLLGNPGITAEEVQYVWEQTLDLTV